MAKVKDRKDFIKRLEKKRKDHSDDKLADTHVWKIMKVFEEGPDTFMTLACICGTIVSKLPTVELKP